MKRDYPATARNRDPILAVLKRVLPKEALVLEIASGTGQHAHYFSQKMKGIRWQPSDTDPELLESIRAYRQDGGRPNFLEPFSLDVNQPWPIRAADAVFCANMIHIAPWPCTEALLRGCRRVLASGQPLILYGPFKLGGEHTAPSNASFDLSLQKRDPSWGVRDLDEVRRIASRNALNHEETVTMPANNLCAIFRRR